MDYACLKCNYNVFFLYSKSHSGAIVIVNYDEIHILTNIEALSPFRFSRFSQFTVPIVKMVVKVLKYASIIIFFMPVVVISRSSSSVIYYTIPCISLVQRSSIQNVSATRTSITLLLARTFRLAAVRENASVIVLP